MAAKDEWLKKVGSELAHVCNGDITSDSFGHECKMNNGKIRASIATDGTRMLVAIKEKGKKSQKVSMESHANEMVITRSLSGSIEFLHRFGDSPEVRIEQKGKNIGAIKINSYNDKVKTSLYGWFD